MSYSTFASIIRPYFWPDGCLPRTYALSCFGALGASKACSLVAPLFLGEVTDSLARGQLPLRGIIAFVVLKFLVALFSEMQSQLYVKVQQVAYSQLATRTFGHIHSLSVHWHTHKKAGVVQRALDRGITAASTVVDNLFIGIFPTLLELIVLCSLFSRMYGDPLSALILIGAVLFYVALTILFTLRRRKIRKQMHDADNSANQIVVDSMTNFETIKCFNNEALEVRRYEAAITSHQVMLAQSRWMVTLLNVAQNAIRWAAMGGVLVVTAMDCMQGRVTVGDIISIQALIIQLFVPLDRLGYMYNGVVTALVDTQALSDLLSIQPEVQDTQSARPLRLSHRDSGPTIDFKNVLFRYPPPPAAADGASRATVSTGRWWHRLAFWRAAAAAYIAVPATATGATAAAVTATDDADVEGACSEASDASRNGAEDDALQRNIINGLSFQIRAGTTTAIVGATGSGKSTLSKLLYRLYDVTGGCITVDGQDIRSVTQCSLRAAIGIVPQDTVLFNDTLRFNIKYGRPDATDAEMEAAAQRAQLTDFLASLPAGFDTKVGERGLRLSGGEKQRVAIARTLLRNPPILILDEATSAMDTLTEAQIQSAINSVRTGRTVLSIAHRLSTIKDADEILVLDRGAIVERGTHDALLAMQGRYSALWQQQAAAATEGAPVQANGHAHGSTPAADASSPLSGEASTTAAAGSFTL